MNDRPIIYFRELVEKITNKIINFLLPQDKKIHYLENLSLDDLYNNIPRASNSDFNTNKIRAIFNYRHQLCRQAIWEIKYHANKKLIHNFSQLLYEFILEELSDLEIFHNFKNPILIPIPSSKARLREKGFNQCNLIVRELLKIDKSRGKNNFTIEENLLIKVIDTPHQTTVSNRNKRLINLNKSFAINKKSKMFLNKNLKDNSYILIDDVITTGATMKEALKILKTTGSDKIYGFVLAH